jgi:hypothetical protein
MYMNVELLLHLLLPSIHSLYCFPLFLLVEKHTKNNWYNVGRFDDNIMSKCKLVVATGRQCNKDDRLNILNRALIVGWR